MESSLRHATATVATCRAADVSRDDICEWHWFWRGKKSDSNLFSLFILQHRLMMIRWFDSREWFRSNCLQIRLFLIASQQNDLNLTVLVICSPYHSIAIVVLVRLIESITTTITTTTLVYVRTAPAVVYVSDFKSRPCSRFDHLRAFPLSLPLPLISFNRRFSFWTWLKVFRTTCALFQHFGHFRLACPFSLVNVSVETWFVEFAPSVCNGQSFHLFVFSKFINWSCSVILPDSSMLKQMAFQWLVDQKFSIHFSSRWSKTLKSTLQESFYWTGHSS